MKSSGPRKPPRVSTGGSGQTNRSQIDELVADTREHPFTGIGKPEPLRWEWKGYWSRRITGEHRLIYRVDADLLLIAQCRFHYSPKKKRQKK